MAETPSCSVRRADAPAFDVRSMDLDRCHRLEVTLGLTEYDLKHPGLSHRFDTWPSDVRTKIEKQIATWQTAEPGAAIVLQSSAIHKGTGVVILHYTLPG